MTTITLAPNLGETLAALLRRPWRIPAKRRLRPAEAERSEVAEMLAARPQAFASELDVQTMMTMMSGRC